MSDVGPAGELDPEDELALEETDSETGDDRKPVPRHAQSPELGEAVQLETAETLEAEPGDEPLDSGYVPPDRPSPASRYRITGEESLERKLEQESSEEPGADPRRTGRLTPDDDPDSDTTTGRDAGIAGGAASAEEAAMHTDEPPDQSAE